MTNLAYDPSPAADNALRIIAQLAYNMPDGDTAAACCPLVEQLGGETVVKELLANKMVRELPVDDLSDGNRVGMTDLGLRFIDAKISSGHYEIENEGLSGEDWNGFSISQI